MWHDCTWFWDQHSDEIHDIHSIEPTQIAQNVWQKQLITFEVQSTKPKVAGSIIPYSTKGQSFVDLDFHGADTVYIYIYIYTRT